MSPRPNPSAECARACEWASLRLDSRLSEFESVLLDAHLVHCLDCQAFAATIGWATEALRSAPLEAPAVPFAFPARRTARRRGVAAGSVAAIAAAAAVLVAVGLQLSAGGNASAARHVNRAMIGLKERQLDQLDSSGQSRALRISPGVAAARQATLNTVAPAAQPAQIPQRDLSTRYQLEVGV
jgi:predicted anti-sigma-YlaC factor YlaD